MGVAQYHLYNVIYGLLRCSHGRPWWDLSFNGICVVLSAYTKTLFLEHSPFLPNYWDSIQNWIDCGINWNYQNRRPSIYSVRDTLSAKSEHTHESYRKPAHKVCNYNQRKVFGNRQVLFVSLLRFCSHALTQFP